MKLNQSNMKKKLGMTKEEINIVLTFQENMPILQEEVDGFAVNTRQLHTQLGVGKDYSTWIKGRIKKYNFKENCWCYSFINNSTNINICNFTSSKFSKISRKNN